MTNQIQVLGIRVGRKESDLSQIICGDALTELKKLPDASVHCCVTSPPYWGLRSYLPDKVQLREDLTSEEIETLKKELTLLGLNDTIRI